MSLDELGIKYETDKASRHPDIQGHDYCRHYEEVFGSRRANVISLLEIGVGGGQSIRMWREYFPKGDIYGVDNNPDAVSVPETTFVLGDQGSPEFWAKFITEHGGDWDIIIDDGSHAASDIKTSFECLWQHLNPGGFYCIEDVHVFYQGEPNSGKDWLHNLICDIHASRRPDINWARLSTALVILNKRHV